MTRPEPTHERSNLINIIVFCVLQIIIIGVIFKWYENIVEGVSYYSEPALVWSSLFTFINCLILFLFMKNRISKLLMFSIFNLSFFSVFAVPSLLKSRIEYSAVISMTFLVAGLFSAFNYIQSDGKSVKQKDSYE